jgi:hypothetical protein
MFPFVYVINRRLGTPGIRWAVYSCPGGARAPIQQNACSPGKTSQQWTMNQYGGNLEIRTARADRCMEVMRADKGIYGEVKQRPCNSSIN